MGTHLTLPSRVGRAAQLRGHFLQTTALALIFAAGHVAEVRAQEVLGGDSTIASTTGATVTTNTDDVLTLTQEGQRGVVAWDSLDLAAGKTMNFDQQAGASSVTLNRNASFDTPQFQIDGTVNAPGSVWFANPNGVFIGPEAVLDVGGLMAAAASVSVDDDTFVDGEGDIPFFRGSSEDSVVILDGTVGGGDNATRTVVLVAPEVGGTGRVVINGDPTDDQPEQVAIVSANSFTMDPDGDGLLSYTVITNDTEGDEALPRTPLDLSGLDIEGPTPVLIDGRTLDSSLNRVVSLGSIAEATTVEIDGDSITLGAGETISATGDISLAADAGFTPDVAESIVTVEGGIFSAGGDVSLIGDAITIVGTEAKIAAGGSVELTATAGVEDFEGDGGIEADDAAVAGEQISIISGASVSGAFGVDVRASDNIILGEETEIESVGGGAIVYADVGGDNVLDPAPNNDAVAPPDLSFETSSVILPARPERRVAVFADSVDAIGGIVPDLDTTNDATDVGGVVVAGADVDLRGIDVEVGAAVAGGSLFAFTRSSDGGFNGSITITGVDSTTAGFSLQAGEDIILAAADDIELNGSAQAGGAMIAYANIAATELAQLYNDNLLPDDAQVDLGSGEIPDIGFAGAFADNIVDADNAEQLSDGDIVAGTGIFVGEFVDVRGLNVDLSGAQATDGDIFIATRSQFAEGNGSMTLSSVGLDINDEALDVFAAIENVIFLSRGSISFESTLGRVVAGDTSSGDEAGSIIGYANVQDFEIESLASRGLLPADIDNDIDFAAFVAPDEDANGTFDAGLSETAGEGFTFEAVSSVEIRGSDVSLGGARTADAETGDVLLIARGRRELPPDPEAEFVRPFGGDVIVNGAELSTGEVGVRAAGDLLVLAGDNIALSGPAEADGAAIAYANVNEPELEQLFADDRLPADADDSATLDAGFSGAIVDEFFEDGFIVTIDPVSDGDVVAGTGTLAGAFVDVRGTSVELGGAAATDGDVFIATRSLAPDGPSSLTITGVDPADVAGVSVSAAENVVLVSQAGITFERAGDRVVAGGPSSAEAPGAIIAYATLQDFEIESLAARGLVPSDIDANADFVAFVPQAEDDFGRVINRVGLSDTSVDATFSAAGTDAAGDGVTFEGFDFVDIRGTDVSIGGAATNDTENGNISLIARGRFDTLVIEDGSGEVIEIFDEFVAVGGDVLVEGFDVAGNGGGLRSVGAAGDLVILAGDDVALDGVLRSEQGSVVYANVQRRELDRLFDASLLPEDAGSASVEADFAGAIVDNGLPGADGDVIARSATVAGSDFIDVRGVDIDLGDTVTNTFVNDADFVEAANVWLIARGRTDGTEDGAIPVAGADVRVDGLSVGNDLVILAPGDVTIADSFVVIDDAFVFANASADDLAFLAETSEAGEAAGSLLPSDLRVSSDSTVVDPAVVPGIVDADDDGDLALLTDDAPPSQLFGDIVVGGEQVELSGTLGFFGGDLAQFTVGSALTPVSGFDASGGSITIGPEPAAGAGIDVRIFSAGPVRIGSEARQREGDPGIDVGGAAGAGLTINPDATPASQVLIQAFGDFGLFSPTFADAFAPPLPADGSARDTAFRVGAFENGVNLVSGTRVDGGATVDGTDFPESLQVGAFDPIAQCHTGIAGCAAEEMVVVPPVVVPPVVEPPVAEPPVVEPPVVEPPVAEPPPESDGDAEPDGDAARPLLTFRDEQQPVAADGEGDAEGAAFVAMDGLVDFVADEDEEQDIEATNISDETEWR